METPWRTAESANPRDQPPRSAARRKSLWKAYAEESFEERTQRSRGAATWTLRRR